MGNTREVNGNAAILARINKGWKPNRYLTNIAHRCTSLLFTHTQTGSKPGHRRFSSYP